MRTTRGAAGLLALVLPLGLVLTGCSQQDKPAADPRKVLASAKRNLDSTPGVRIVLSAERLPDGVDGLLEARGIGTHAPAFTGTIKISASGVTADASVVATDGTVYAKLPFTSSFEEIDPGDYGAPDPADLLAEQGGLSSMLTAAKDVKQGAQVRDGKTVLTRYSARVPGRTMASIIPSARPAATFDATFTVDDRERLAKAVLNGPFYPKAGDVTYTVTFTDYGIDRDIRAP